MELSCIVLAGGKSTRLGRNKIVENIGNKSLLEHVISCLSSLKTEIILVSAPESTLPKLENISGISYVKDIYPGKGSLGGVYSGLVESKTLHNLVVACDMPFLNFDLIRFMISLAGEYDAVVPNVDDKLLEPLHAIYSKSCIPKMHSLIEQNRLSILELFPMVRVRYLSNAEINRFDSRHLSFFNINTEEDLKAGKELARKEGFFNDKC